MTGGWLLGWSMSIPFFSSFRGSRSDAKPETSPPLPQGYVCAGLVSVSLSYCLQLVPGCQIGKTSKPITQCGPAKPWSLTPHLHGHAKRSKTSPLMPRGHHYFMSRDGELLVGSGFSVLWRASEPSSEVWLSPQPKAGGQAETAERERGRGGEGGTVPQSVMVRTASKELCQ